MKIQLLIATLLTTLYGCQTDIELAQLIDQNSPIILTVRSTNGQLSDFRKDTILVNSDKWQKLVQFTNNNTADWKSTPASYISDFYLQRGNFRLLGWKNGTSVVIDFNDSDGQTKQLMRTTKPGELNFLIE
ncbi:hypothetical protein [Fulvivirga sp.]|uniref:hypothetical protein n=1 Tax=Fulvivirga sp. TaxID=1931237 RepID=UPI0032ED5156